MKRTNLLMIALLLLCSFNSTAQSSSISNILNIKSLKKSGEIMKDDKLVGYFMFYFKEKEDRKTSTYIVEFFDDNYNSINEFEVTRPRNTVLFETHYNGEAFLLFFYDAKTGYEYASYNLQGELLGSEKIEKKELSSWDLADIQQKQSAVQPISVFNTTGNEGFLRSRITKEGKMGYSLVKYDNKMNQIWEYKSDAGSKLVEQIGVSQVDESIITATRSTKKSLMTKKADMTFLIIDSQTGELISEMQMGDKELGKQSILKSYINPTNNNITLIGEYYNPGDDILKDKSQGLFVRELNKSGRMLATKKYSWSGDIAKFKSNLSAEQKKEASLPFSIFFHDIIMSENGHFFIIGEQYRKQISAGAIAGKALAAASGGTSNASSFEIRISDMIVIELDERKTLVDYKVIEKKRNSVLLPSGAAFYSSAFLGFYVKSIGGFDYYFTSKDSENDNFSVIYRDMNKKEQKGAKKSDVMLGVVDIKQGELTTDRVPFNTEYNYFWINPAKPGNISIIEYDKKQKELYMRLEKISY